MKIFMLLFLSLFVGCSQTGNIPKDKIDPSLADKLTRLEQNKSDETLNFIGKCTTEITPSIKEELAAAGISIHSVSKDIFTGTGNYKAIIKIAGTNYIKWIEEPKETFPIKNK